MVLRRYTAFFQTRFDLIDQVVLNSECFLTLRRVKTFNVDSTVRKISC